MQLRLIAVGNKMPDWVKAGFEEYAKRLPTGFHLTLLEIPAEKRLKSADITRLTDKEGEKIVENIPSDHLVVALDVKGQAWSSEILAKQLGTWHSENQKVDFLVGGPDGLSERCLKRAQIKCSLSNLTLPHPIVRIVLAEQLYRAWSILMKHPYHR